MPNERDYRGIQPACAGAERRRWKPCINAELSEEVVTVDLVGPATMGHVANSTAQDAWTPWVHRNHPTPTKREGNNDAEDGLVDF